MLVQYERTPLSRRAVCAHGEVDYEYEGGLSYDEFLDQLDQRVQISKGSDCYSVGWHQPTNRVYVHAMNTEFFLTSPELVRLTMRNVLEALGLSSDRATLDWSEDENSTLENILDNPVETVTLHIIRIMV